MKKLSKFVLVGALLFSGFTTSCGFFGDEGYTIKEVETLTNNDGSVTLKIIYTDSTIDPTTITLDKGEAGVGIDRVETAHNDDNTLLNVLIYFTDGKTKEFSLPIVHGKDGLGIKSITESVTETGEKSIIISYTDSSVEPTVITLPKGETGNGIKEIQYLEDPITHAVTLTVIYTNGNSISVPISAPNGIKEIDVKVDDATGHLVFNFILTDGTKLPPVDTGKALTSWLNGYEIPSNTQGHEGDFYFNLDSLIIYIKKDGKWQVVVDFKNSMEQDTANVHFDLNCSDGSFNGLAADYKIPTGKNFYYAGISVPTPVRLGYRFGGWYTEKVYNVTLGAFNNLTTVFEDMTLYANWIIIN